MRPYDGPPPVSNESLIAYVRRDKLDRASGRSDAATGARDRIEAGSETGRSSVGPAAAPDPEWHGALLDKAGRMDYGDYLGVGVDGTFGPIHPLTSSPHEQLFINQHRAAEVWMHQTLHEIGRTRTALGADDFAEASDALRRARAIMDHQAGAWDVLRTLKPEQFAEFRDSLGSASGFQSFQYRAIEFSLGNKNPATMKPFRDDPDRHALVQRAFDLPSIQDEAIGALHRGGLPIEPGLLTRDVREPLGEQPSVLAAWRQVYDDPGRYGDLHQLGEDLTGLDDSFQKWRRGHASTVGDIIGNKPGTGGTDGVPYLDKMAEVRMFPELTRVRAERAA